MLSGAQFEKDSSPDRFWYSYRGLKIANLANLCLIARDMFFVLLTLFVLLFETTLKNVPK